MKKYPAYKDSGVEWLGEIPVHWEIKPLKYVVDINNDKLNENTDAGYTFKYVDISNVNYGGIINVPKEIKFRDAPSRARRIIRSGDTIVTINLDFTIS